jgi:hypothetical protein
MATKTVTWTFRTNGPAGTYYWTNSGTTSASDFSDGLNSGSFTVSGTHPDRYGTITRTLATDEYIEPTETITIQVRRDSITGNVLVTATPVSILESSAAGSGTFPPPPSPNPSEPEFTRVFSVTPASWTWNVVSATTNIDGFMSDSGQYFGKSGFSLDRIDGSIWLTAGAYPQQQASYPAYQEYIYNRSVDWQLLRFKGRGTNQLSNDNTSNVYQLTNSLYPKWGMMDSVNISGISVGSSANLYHSTYSVSAYGVGYPYNSTAKPAYIIRRTGSNTATIELGANRNDYNVSDTGTSVTLRSWYDYTNELFGGTNEVGGYDAVTGDPIVTVPFSRGVKTLTWT